MKKLLLVINTLGRAGAEIALLGLLKNLDPTKYDISLYVIMAQGEMIKQVPDHVKVLNSSFNHQSVLSKQGRWSMMKTSVAAFFRNGACASKLRYLLKTGFAMIKAGTFQIDKLLWRVLSDGAQRFDETFDLAIAYIEGGSAYYVADHVKARKKAAFIHIAYENAGYTRQMDQDCWGQFDQIFAVSDEVKEYFAKFYPEYSNRLAVFHNVIDREHIWHRSQEEGGFEDDYKGLRILTVGRLTYQKGYDIAIEAMALLKKLGCQAKWYVLGEGDQRKKLEKKIADLRLQDHFCLMGAVENPYPYYRQTDLYVHATRFEGKSIAIQEAQTLGCAIIASDSDGNREHIINHEDGIICELTPKSIADNIRLLLEDKDKRKAFSRAARRKAAQEEAQIHLLTELLMT
ncbi:MAG: glycosyltransferase [Firmicutes bacterium]|jgi:glycosyltransferase involved in cell wall biosynthesis|nr:glycosyltransferase [Bacillota bacterium]